MSTPDRRARLDRDHVDLSVRRQCALLGLARSGVYRRPAPVDDSDQSLMRRIDELYTERPFFGSRRIAFTLGANRKRMQRLMRLMGIAALGPKPGTSKPAPGHKIYPYLLRNMTIERPNQVWATDITYLPIGSGFLYLVAIMDWASRAVLAWRLSNTMDVSFCISALEEALARFGKPDIFNSDQGQPVHQRRLHRHARTSRHSNLDGRTRALDGQRLYRAAVAQPEARRHLSEGLRGRPRSARRNRILDRIL